MVQDRTIRTTIGRDMGSSCIESVPHASHFCQSGYTDDHRPSESGSYKYKLPSNIAPGGYLLRNEAVNLALVDPAEIFPSWYV